METLSYISANRLNMRRRVPDAEIIAEAKKFRHKSDWGERGRYYQLVLRDRRHLAAQCFSHMEPVECAETSLYQVYAYVFLDNTIYIGLTRRPKRRRRSHLKGGAVRAKASKGFLYYFQLFADGVDVEVACALEQNKILEYRAAGWTMLNKHRGGGVGSLYRYKYSFHGALGRAQECTSLSDFKRKHVRWCNWAYNNGRLDEIIAECEKTRGWPRPVHGKWSRNGVLPGTLQECLSQLKVSGITSILQWGENFSGSYAKACRTGWRQTVIDTLGLTKSYNGRNKACRIPVTTVT